MFKKTYLFSQNTAKGIVFLKTIVKEDDVLVEVRPKEYVNVRDLWGSRPSYQRAHDKRVKDIIVQHHIDEYHKMIDLLKNFKTEDEQDKYIREEMRSQGYTFVKVMNNE